jgi:hypothetical protein
VLPVIRLFKAYGKDNVPTRKVAPKIVEIFKKLAFWHSLVSPRVLSRKTWEKIRARIYDITVWATV